MQVERERKKERKSEDSLLQALKGDRPLIWPPFLGNERMGDVV